MRRAVELIHSAGSGAVLTLLSMPPEDRRLDLADAMYDAVMQSILTDVPVLAEEGTTAAAVASGPSCRSSRCSPTLSVRFFPSGWTEPSTAEPVTVPGAVLLATRVGVPLSHLEVSVDQGFVLDSSAVLHLASEGMGPADQLGWASTYDAEYVALTQLQADALVTLNAELARSVEVMVAIASIDALRRDLRGARVALSVPAPWKVPSRAA